MTDNDSEELGPVDYLVVEFPADRQPDGSALPHLVDLVNREIIRLIDLCFIQRTSDGTTTTVDIAELDLSGDFDIPLFAGASVGLLDDDDIAELGSTLEPGCSAAVIIYENRWAAPFASALRRNGAQFVAHGTIPVDELLASLEA